MILLLLKGIFFGVLLSIPPGPATTRIIKQSRKDFSLGLKLIAEMLIADLVMLAIGFLFLFPLREYFQSPWLQVAAGLFLLIFALSEYFSKAEKTTRQNKRSIFFIVLMKPAAWLGVLGVLTIAELSVHFLLGYELGIAIYFLFLIFFCQKISERMHYLLFKTGEVVMACIGVGLLLKAIPHLI